MVLWSGKQAVTRKAGGTGVSGTEDRLESKGASTEEPLVRGRKGL